MYWHRWLITIGLLNISIFNASINVADFCSGLHSCNGNIIFISQSAFQGWGFFYFIRVISLLSLPSYILFNVLLFEIRKWGGHQKHAWLYSVFFYLLEQWEKGSHQEESSRACRGKETTKSLLHTTLYINGRKKWEKNKCFLVYIYKLHAIRAWSSGTVPDFDTLSWLPAKYDIIPEI